MVIFSRFYPVKIVLCTVTLIALTALSIHAQTFPRKDLSFNDSWKFYRGDIADNAAAQISYAGESAWDPVCLPHTVRLESAKKHGSFDYYLGYCWYRKSFAPDTSFTDKKIFLEFGAAMQTAQIWVNGTLKTSNQGGYSPFSIDITNDYSAASTNVVAARLNNNPSADFAPGDLKVDFYYYGGLYRDVTLHVMDKLHITDALYANIPAGGGVFVTYPAVTTSQASIQVKTNVINEYADSRTCVLTTSLVTTDNQTVQTLPAVQQTIAAGANYTFTQTITISNPKLWSPASPNLYVVRSQVFDNTRPADMAKTTIGIRTIAFSKTNGFQINGNRLYTVGANRHQDWGAIGNAVPVSGQFRDALRMKEAGINFVRLSHYIQHPAFLDACDKLGITVQATMPGWQNNAGQYGKQTYVNNCVRDLRTAIRLYRNHPCVVMWESVLNESNPPASFSTLTQAAAHQEFPGDQMFTCGQEGNNIMDIYQAAVQQGGRDYAGSKPAGISEYGHWEYGGFTYGAAASNQPRSTGESGMLQLARNQADAMNLDHGMSGLAVDAVWVWSEGFGMDGYVDANGSIYSKCGGGIVDIFRIPKFSYYFYQSQRDPKPAAILPHVQSGPMVFIASHWTAQSNLKVTVFSNCEQVKLSLNGTAIGVQSPNTAGYSHLQHAPCTFTIPSFSPGTLHADGLIGGAVAATHDVKTPGTASKIGIVIDTATMQLKADGSDLAVVYASIQDSSATGIPSATSSVQFGISGPGVLLYGDGNPEIADAGVATMYIQTKYKNPGIITVTAASPGLTSASASVSSAAVSDTYTAAIPYAVPLKHPARSDVRLIRAGQTLMISGLSGSEGDISEARLAVYTLQGRLLLSRSFDANKKTPLGEIGRFCATYVAKLTIGKRIYAMQFVTE